MSGTNWRALRAGLINALFALLVAGVMLAAMWADSVNEKRVKDEDAKYTADLQEQIDVLCARVDTLQGRSHPQVPNAHDKQ